MFALKIFLFFLVALKVVLFVLFAPKIFLFVLFAPSQSGTKVRLEPPCFCAATPGQRRLTIDLHFPTQSEMRHFHKKTIGEPALPTSLGRLVCCRWPESRQRGSRRTACPQSASWLRWACPWGTCSAPPASWCPGPRGRESQTRNQSKAWKGRPDSLGENTMKDAVLLGI